MTAAALPPAFSPGTPNARGGCLVLVVGPSGAGKDTLLRRSRLALADEDGFVFPRRYITRPAGDPNEDHIALTESEFRAYRHDRKFSLIWHAHGLHYALPRSVHGDIGNGRIVAANASRTVIDRADHAFPRVGVIHVIASAATLARRIGERGRETPDEQVQRLKRAGLNLPPGVEAETLINEGPLDAVAEGFIVLLRSFGTEPRTEAS